MVKNIHLHFNDEKLFFRLKADKLIRERRAGLQMTWEEYVKMLFGFNRGIKEVKSENDN